MDKTIEKYKNCRSFIENNSKDAMPSNENETANRVANKNIHPSDNITLNNDILNENVSKLNEIFQCKNIYRDISDTFDERQIQDKSNDFFKSIAINLDNDDFVEEHVFTIDGDLTDGMNNNTAHNSDSLTNSDVTIVISDYDDKENHGYKINTDYKEVHSNKKQNLSKTKDRRCSYMNENELKLNKISSISKNGYYREPDNELKKVLQKVPDKSTTKLESDDFIENSFLNADNNNDGEHRVKKISQSEGPSHASVENLSTRIEYRFAGTVFRSFRDKPNSFFGRERCLSNCIQLKPEAELSRSQYSLVSCNDLTAGAIQLWLGLPEEVKYDAALAPFRQFYEKEHGNLHDSKFNGSSRKQRLPSVNSAPHLNNNHQTIRDEPFNKTEKQPKKTDKLIEDHDDTITPKKSMFQNAQHYTKMTLLLVCWLFFTTAFLMYNEKKVNTRISSVAPFEVKSYPLSSSKDGFTISLELSGPFLSVTNEMKLNSSHAAAAKKMEVWVERVKVTGERNVLQTSDKWILILQDEIDLDFTKGEPRSTTLRLKPFVEPESNITSDILLRIRTTANKSTPFTMIYTLNPLDVQTGVIYACILLIGLYVLIIFEIINRTMAAVLVSTTSLATLAIVGERPSLPEIISWLDVETLLLLFSMMLLVAIMAETGLFDFLAVFTFEVTKGKLWPLISLLCAITAVLSTFLDNVTTVLLMTPVTIRLCEVMDLNPIPILMSMVLFSNIGGTATPVGDPPNVIIASNKAVAQAGINFTNFTLHMSFGIVLVCIQTYLQLRFIYRDTNKLRLNEPRDIQDLRHQISIWRRAAESLPHMSRDEQVVRERLERKVKKLTAQLESLVKESNKRACPKDTFRSTLNEMKEKYKIRDKSLLIQSTVAIGFVVAVFFLHSLPELNRVSLGWTALLGAILLLTLADREDLEPILHRVEWSTLLFFASLFVLMEALSKLGLIEFIGGVTESVILSVDESARLAVSILLMLWVSGVTSAFVDNIPLTTMMVRVVTSLGSNPTLNLPMAPLIWALSFGACLGGNGTLIGASANVVCAGVAEQHGYKFSFMQFFKVGFPVMLGHLVVASGYLMICHCVFTWH